MPAALAERTSVRGGGAPRAAGASFVLYWMRTSGRGHENPALDVAITVGDQLGLPVLVYQGLSERYPFASDRHHAFALEGARDAHRELSARGVASALHVERDGHRGPHLRALAARSAMVVTEEMPVPPLAGWTRDLAARAECPLWTVDTACVVPMPLVDRRPERAFAFRDRTAALRAERVARTWVDAVPAIPAPSLADLELPFEPVDLEQVDVAELLAACAIDHAVAPVTDTRGGATAGYARWRGFVDRIGRYAATRNDPLWDGVSRMSAYLHHGHVSPLRLAREAAEISGPGATKFLDELLVWRELAYAWCYHRDGDVETEDAIPGWARATLDEHRCDPRPRLPSWETLARGRTGDPLWDAAQRSLLVHGELHNNLRMTWGKALVGWTPDLRSAMDALVDLNHRYALDGRDPASYGGLWWCLGLFDRPFTPASPVFGTVRSRSTAGHARRLDVDRYAEQVAGRPIAAALPRVAVIGAGIAGLTCARALLDHGLDVTVFDKGRGPGGRASTRRADGARFDHGAQYFTARDPRFARQVSSWLEDDVVARWHGRFGTLRAGVVGPDPRPGPRYVGAPTMSAVPRHLATDLTVRLGVRIERVERVGDVWRLVAEDGGEAGAFDLVLVATPAPQAAPLLVPAPALAARAASAELAPCIAMVATIDPGAVPLPLDGAFVEGSILSWIARDGSKPGRARADTWVLHASPAWSAAHFDDDPRSTIREFLGAFVDAVGAPVPAPTFVDVHRWRFALPNRSLDERSGFDAANRLGFCGDWCGGSRVEGAFLSGADCAGRVLRWVCR